ncbi:MAG: PmoA family protein [Planctomycetaceae bacterium]|nr:PmoA family protein [Planctomycetaceae bacterium]
MKIREIFLDSSQFKVRKPSSVCVLFFGILFCCVIFFPCVAGFLAADTFQFVEKDGKQLVLTEGNLPIFTYQFDAVEHENVPRNNPRRLAGCYIHPLHGLLGEVLTDNAPTDHFHHHGVFWTWPHVGVHEPDGKIEQYDLWTSNTALKQYFVRWIDKKITDKTATFEVENGWFVGKPEDGNKIMSEQVKVIVHRIQTANADGTDKTEIKSRAIDFEFIWKPVGRSISLRGSEGKSYGGFSIRFKPFIPEKERKNKNITAKRNDVNVITVPAGVAKNDLPETPLAWADYTSQFDGRKSQSGAAIFVPKTHPNFPPTWLTRYYGPLCVGWPGVKDKLFQPNEEIKLQYRIWIHEGTVTTKQLENAYENYK